MVRPGGFPIFTLTIVKSGKLFSRYWLRFAFKTGEVRAVNHGPTRDREDICHKYCWAALTLGQRGKVISPSSTSSYWGRENHSKAPDTHPGKQGPSTRRVIAREPGTDSRLQTSDQGRLRLHLSEGPRGRQDMQMCCWISWDSELCPKGCGSYCMQCSRIFSILFSFFNASFKSLRNTTASPPPPHTVD